MHNKLPHAFFVLEEQQYMAFGSPDLCSWNKNCPLIIVYMYTAEWPTLAIKSASTFLY